MSSPSPTFPSQFKHTAAAVVGNGSSNSSTAGGGRSPMRRVSLPSALPPPRTPNSLSPKLGFLKEISEFDIDPPFISPACSSSSSADTSPMLLSPSFQRPASARLYRRNPHHRHSQPNSPSTRKARIFNRQSVADERPVPKEEEDDGFRWTDVDGFYGRKNSIPLQQLLANDLALLNSANLLGDYGDTKPSMVSNGLNSNNNNHLIPLNVDQQQQQQQQMNIPSDITEDEDEEDGTTDKGLIQRQQRRDMELNQQEMNGQPREDKINMRQSLGMPQPLLDSPTKRKLFMNSKMRSYEGGTKEHLDDTEEEENDGEAEAQNLDRSFSAKVKFSPNYDAFPLADGGLEEAQSVRKLAKEKRKRVRTTQHRTAQRLRHFSIDAYGQRVVDSGTRTVRASIGPKTLAAQQPRNSKSRRATCPEIWLSAAEDSELPRVNCALRLYGLMNCGKKTVAKQLASSLELESANEDLASIDSEDLQRPYRTVGFMLNEREIQMEIIQGSLLPENRHFTPGGEVTIFAVVYSVDNRESFIRASQILLRLYKEAPEASAKRGRGRKSVDKDKVSLILIANKIDLQRKRRVSPIEGKMLAKIYKCPFVELSAMLSANMDTLGSEVLRKLQKYLQTRERLMLQQRRDSSGDSATPSSPRHALVNRLFERTRRFAKSCEDWIAARIVTI
uniref:Septin-type G domain-containing protein n=1 Tax=Globodera pallida TaxID=36090 RepID=A0A183C229_GLOPA